MFKVNLGTIVYAPVYAPACNKSLSLMVSKFSNDQKHSSKPGACSLSWGDVC